MKIEIKIDKWKIGDDNILHDIDFELQPQGITSMLGANGSGKTQLIKCIMGFNKINPKNGYIKYDAVDISDIKLKDRAKLISYVPQDNIHNISYTVEEFISFGYSPYLSFYEDTQKFSIDNIHTVMDKLSILYLKDKRIDEISGGEYRLAYLCRALIQKSKYMILDEPISSLDFEKQHIFMEYLRTNSKHMKKSVLLSVHDPNIALKYSDYIFFIKKGSIVSRVENSVSNSDELKKSFYKLYGDNISISDEEDRLHIEWR